MNYLVLRYQRALQHYKERNPIWIKSYVALLGDHAVSKREMREVVEYAKAVWVLSDTAKLVLSYLELLAARKNNRIPYDDIGWVRAELKILQVSKRPRLLASVLAELLAVGLAEVVSVTDINDASTASLYSENLNASGGIEGCGEEGAALESELPAHSRLSAPLFMAAEAYDRGAARCGWPRLRREILPEIERHFADITAKAKSLEPDFDWVICIARAVEQEFVGTIAGFGFEWLLRTESNGVRLNALKVWDRAFENRNERAARDDKFGDFRDDDPDFRRNQKSGFVVRLPRPKLPTPQSSFPFIRVGESA